MKERKFTESFTLEEQSSVDRISGTINNIVALKPLSANGRRYSDAALQDCAELMTGAKCFLNHDPAVENLVGDFFGATVRDNKVYASLSLLESTPHRNFILDIASNKPNLAGFSINARGKFSNELSPEGYEVVEGIVQLYSVDLVGQPATTSGLFESYNKTVEPVTIEQARSILHGETPFDIEKRKLHELLQR